MRGSERRAASRGAVAAGCLLAIVGGVYLGIAFRWFRAPYPPFGKQIAWFIGKQDSAYNFDVVVPGTLYRSGRPDERLVWYAQERYGVKRIVSLAGPFLAHATARRLGIEVHVFDWTIEKLPPPSELEEVLGMIGDGEPTLVHCWAGSDRTGVTVAAYRVRRQNWRFEDAIREMARYGHDRDLHAGLHRELKELLGP
jgi:hypothetical protein